MATYRRNNPSQVEIVSRTSGDFHAQINNHNSVFALQLRENGPTGRVVAFINRGQQGAIVQFPTPEPVMLFPVWIGFNRQTQSIIRVEPTEGVNAIHLTPSALDAVPTAANFPFTQAGPVEFPVRAPAAVVRVQNNLEGQGVFFRVGSAPQRGIDAPQTVQGTLINSGDWQPFSMEVPGATAQLNLNVFFQVTNAAVPVRFNDSYGNPIHEMPTLTAGYNYLVIFNHISGQPMNQPSYFTAVITRGEAIDTSAQIEAP